MNDVPHIDPSSFAITRTLRGIRRTIGDSKKQAQLVTVHDLRLMFATLDMDSSEDVAFWLAIILCFRGLLRKSNVVEPGMAIRLSDVQFTPWGVLISVVRSKTISFKERVLRIPFNIAPGSIFCVHRFIRLLLSLVTHPSGSSQLVSYVKQGRWVRATYSWFMKRLTGVCIELKLVGVSTHSLRRGGASALEASGFSLLEIKDMGDWASSAVLQYICKTLDQRRNLDERMCEALFN